jgi:hypothetical protein
MQRFAAEQFFSVVFALCFCKLQVIYSKNSQNLYGYMYILLYIHTFEYESIQFYSDRMLSTKYEINLSI